MARLLQARRALLIEDNPGDARLIAEMIADSSQNLVLETAPSLAVGLERLQAPGIDVVLLDLGLPDSEGLGTFARLQESHPGLAVIVLTGNRDEEVALEAVRQGAQDFLVKGRFDTDLLVHGIVYAIGRKQSERALRESEERYRELYERTPLAYQSLDADGRILIVNQAWLDSFGYEREFVMGRLFAGLLTPEYASEFEASFARLKSAGTGRAEFEMVHGDGSRRFVATDGRVGYDDEGAFRQTHCILTDITQQKLVEEASRAVVAQLEELAMVDSLTGLLNRRGFDFRAEQVALDAARDREGLTVLYADMDNMKFINDEHGHAQGDQALIDVATVLRSTFRSADVIGRLGGDEFAVLTTGMSGDAQEFLRTRLDSALDDLVEREGRPYRLAVSSGMAASAIADIARIEQLVQVADARMYEHKLERRATAAQSALERDGL